MLKDFSEEVLMNISSFLIGKPEELRLKSNKQLVKLQKPFKIIYQYADGFGEYADYDGKLLSMENEYSIVGKKLSLDLLLKQQDRIRKLFDRTYDEANFDVNLKEKSYDVNLHIKMYGEIRYRFRDTNVFTNTDICVDDELSGLDRFLMDTKSFFEY